MASRVRFLLSQLGAKPGAEESLARLLDAQDLASMGSTGSPQWRRLDQRTWRTGVVTHPQPWQTEARAAGSVTAWRSFRTRPRSRWLWLQWVPLATPDGAAQALADAADPASGLRNLNATVGTMSSRNIDPPAGAGADRASATEELTTGPDPVMTLRCTAGRHLVVMCASGAGWDWPTLTALAELQLRRLPMT